MEVTVGVIVVTRNQRFFETGMSVLSDLRGEVFQNVSLDVDIGYTLRESTSHPVYQEARSKAIDFLSKRKDSISVSVIQGDSLKRVSKKITAHSQNQDFQVGMVFIDYTESCYEELTPQDIDQELTAFYSFLDKVAIPVFYSPSSTAVFTLSNKRNIHYQPKTYIECILPDDNSVLQTDLLCLWMDFFEMSYFNRRVKPVIKKIPNNSMGEWLINFLQQRAGIDWQGYYYTGSLVSNFINFLEYSTDKLGVLLLRGASEHSLACGAMANWQLYNRPFLLVVTSGMIDEFKGTLANLREARAKGFIICAESRAGQWFPFQGTISSDEDTRDVLKARRIPYVYLNDVEALAEGLQEAAELYDSDQGPVVLLATQVVLDSSSSIDVGFPVFCDPSPEKVDIKTQIWLEEVVDLINNGPDRLLWQCGSMNEEELELTMSIAQRAGIALVDSLTHPGTVAKYYKGKYNPNYLGTLAVYGYSSRVYNYLHTNGRINPVTEQCLFFLKNKLVQAATPFPEGRLLRKLKIVQVTNNEKHIAPFCDIPLVIEYLTFLKYIDKYLDVSPDRKQRRYQKIRAVVDTHSDVVSKLSRVPMSPNYFFSRLNELLESLIVENGFDYTGVYDVGRCGLSAVRNVSRTRQGFSGWYGRALMGDALQSTTSLAFTANNNIIAFIGDGAKGIVPDVLPGLIENAITYPDRLNKSITLFFFMNGGHSVIQSYQERILFNRSSRQMRLVNVLSSDWEEEINGLQIVSRTFNTFDSEKIASALLKPNSINLFSIIVSHNNEGDGLSLATASGWQRDKPVVPIKGENNIEKELNYVLVRNKS